MKLKEVLQATVFPDTQLAAVWLCDLRLPLRARRIYWSMPEAKSRRTSSRSTMLRSPVNWLKVARRAVPSAPLSPRADAASRPSPRRPSRRKSWRTRTTRPADLTPTFRPPLCSCLLSSKPKALLLHQSVSLPRHHRSVHASVSSHSITNIPASQVQLYPL